MVVSNNSLNKRFFGGKSLVVFKILILILNNFSTSICGSKLRNTNELNINLPAHNLASQNFVYNIATLLKKGEKL